MIDISVVRGKRITVNGHAGYAAKGQDIVCAAISALFQTMCMADGIGFREDDDGSKTAVIVRPCGNDAARLICKGMEQIARQYPTYVRYRIVPDTL